MKILSQNIVNQFMKWELLKCFYILKTNGIIHQINEINII